MSGWLKGDNCVSGGDDRVELIDDTVEARAAFGENFGAFEFRLTRQQVEGLLAGKAIAFDINSTFAETKTM